MMMLDIIICITFLPVQNKYPATCFICHNFVSTYQTWLFVPVGKGDIIAPVGRHEIVFHDPHPHTKIT